MLVADHMDEEIKPLKESIMIRWDQNYVVWLQVLSGQPGILENIGT